MEKVMEKVLVNSADVYKGYLILVNKDYPLKKESVSRERLSGIGEGICLENRTASMLMQLLNELKAKKKITAVSGYRSFKEQEKIYTNSLDENGREFTEKYVALPGASEHQTGLAIDLGETKKEINFLCPEFPYKGICQEFREKAASYGFIQRYEKEKEGITGIGHEPWHFRYVGYPHSKIMREGNLTLEEYTEEIENHPYGENPLVFGEGKQKVEISYLEMGEGEERALSFLADAIYQVSGNNKKGVIITKWQGR
ncbi:M15 family metallopeptidase [Anaerocolumna xylanovorans]|uniref:D-alanyl-D-alanine dipeptidase/carboxypeptidase n=1 Tax=Anaerocolumna xylanovorans DSM 12503 TaxID=1121345 RepID=A0A1M7XYZ9_9FIRM|nr:M15 family metallopeptidase [Anaerocolumna xylanovorans]SHO44337.1 D-alanyl-D-alanine dipeptidase/carboxypeptidase [Anaerocolumna xylanovorans DSM 12503]